MKGTKTEIAAASRRAFTFIELLFVAMFLVAAGWAQAAQPSAVPFCSQWRFVRADDPQAQQPQFNDRKWETVTLPHTAHTEPLVAGQNARQWQGVCWYRKAFDLPADARDKKIFLRFDGAMNTAEIWVNGESTGQFMGGYLPYVMDISNLARPGAKNLIAVRLDNRDNPITGPKPLADLDFNLYGGLYRNASLVIKDKLHITDPVLADKVAGGGVFVTFPAMSKEEAIVKVQTHVKNADETPRSVIVKTTLLDARGRVVASLESSPETLAAGTDRNVTQEIRVADPKLWSPKSPYLYQVRSELIEKGRTVDAEKTRIGIRRIEITKDGFSINGEKMFLRGVNRHQEYPYIGNALSDDAQYRDARKIKEAGFDYIRLSHYPQSPAFMDACDELGLVVMNCLMGWQYFGKDPAFTDLKLRECRELVRRDRNHPCVVMWEVSLNESDMPKSFIAKTHAIAHEEYPGDQCYTSGWTGGYDVFMQARQHGGCIKIKDQPCVVSEYGDWEYYAQNAGLEQNKWKDLQPAERNSRQLRGDGEVRLLQQAMNFQEAHSDNLKTTAFADGIWVIFDYNRGYAADIESSGVMDIFRLPKFSYWLFRSQRDAGERVAGNPSAPTIFIANYWTAESPLEVRVFSNCEEVSLYVNRKLIERRRADNSRFSSNVRHAPFIFKLDKFEPGTLRAVGYIGGREVARHERRTPGGANQLTLRFDLNNRPFAASGKDTVFCYAQTLDKADTVLPTADAPVFFGTTSAARLVGHNPILSEAGTATILLDADTAKPACAVYALCLIQEREQTRILSAAASPNGTSAPRYTIHYTTDGTEPAAASPVYRKPIRNAPQLRAAIFVKGLSVASADSRISAASTRDKTADTAKTPVR
jgi:beta-galactosidase